MNKKIVDYKIVYEEYDINLEKKVRESIVDGWQPFGGISYSRTIVSMGTLLQRYSQAMVKYEEE